MTVYVVRDGIDGRFHSVWSTEKAAIEAAEKANSNWYSWWIVEEETLDPTH